MTPLSSCSQGALERRTTVEFSDSAGIPIADTRIAGDAPTCEVSHETVMIGAVEGTEGTEGTPLFGVNGAALLDDGRLVVVNRGSSELMVFSLSGELLSAFGRRGGGPGEFKNLWSVHVRAGDTLVVGDYRPWRFSFFTPEGEFLRSIELKPPEIERPDFAIPLGNGAGFVMEEPLFETQREWVDRVVPLRAYGEDGEFAWTVGEFWLDRWGYLSEELGYVGNPIFGAKATFSHLRDDLILYGTGQFEQLEIWNLSGELKGIVRWESRGRAVESGDADLWRHQRREEIEERVELTPRMEAVIEAQVGAHLPVADLYPGHANVVVSAEGRIWVEEYRRPSDEGPTRWLVFDPNGGFHCAASIPEDLWVLAAGGDRIFGLVRDSLDVEYIVGHDVGSPQARGP